MVNWLWYIQVFAGVMTSLVAFGAVLTGIYSVLRGTPAFLSRISGVDGLDRQMQGIDAKVDQILGDVEEMQNLQYQQAKSYNDLKNTVCTELDIPEEDRPDGLDTLKIRRRVLDEDRTDFTRGGRWSPDEDDPG